MYRQGDLLLIPISSLPTSLCKPKPRLCFRLCNEEEEEEIEESRVLLRTQKNRQYFHEVRHARQFTYKSKLKSTFIEVGEYSSICHDRHTEISLPPGFYRAVFYREYGTRRKIVPIRKNMCTKMVWLIQTDRHRESKWNKFRTHKGQPFVYLDAPFDRQELLRKVINAYSEIGLSPPAVLQFNSPLDAWIAADLLLHVNSPRFRSDFGLLWGRDTEQRIWKEINGQLDVDLFKPIVPINNALSKWYGCEEQFPSRRGLVKCLRSRVKNMAESARRDLLTKMLQESYPNNHFLRDDDWNAILSEAMHSSDPAEARTSNHPPNSFQQGLRLPQGYDFQWLRMDALAAFGVDQMINKYGGLLCIAAAFGPWWPFDKVVVLCNSATSIELDYDDDLHNEYGPALEYGAELKIWALHGITYSTNKSEADVFVNLDAIHSEKNPRRRRFLKKVYGEERYLIDSGAEIIDNDRFGVLYRLSRDNRKPHVTLKFPRGKPGKNGDSRDYFVRVPPDMTQSREAIAWSFGLSELAYNPVFET